MRKQVQVCALWGLFVGVVVLLAGCASTKTRQEGIQALKSLIPVQERPTYEMILLTRLKAGGRAHSFTLKGWRKIIRNSMASVRQRAVSEGARQEDITQRQMTFAMRLIDTSREAKEPLARYALVSEWVLRRTGGKEVVSVAFSLLQRDSSQDVRTWAFRALLRHKADISMLKKAVDLVLRDASGWVRGEVLRMSSRPPKHMFAAPPELTLHALKQCVTYRKTAPYGYVYAPFSGFRFPQFVAPEKLLHKLRGACLDRLIAKYGHAPKRLMPLLKAVRSDTKDPLCKRAALAWGRLVGK